MSNVLKLIIAILACQLAGFIGSLFTTPAIPGWYAALEKPSFNPPNWLLGPVWITLYLFMGIAAYLIWRRGLGEPNVGTALLLFGVQLVINASWSFFFFGLKSPLAGFVVIILLWIVILITALYFLKISNTAAALMLPYIAWVSYAAVLNFSFWRLNP
jgi:tryptophan-rich sensory protein